MMYIFPGKSVTGTCLEPDDDPASPDFPSEKENDAGLPVTQEMNNRQDTAMENVNKRDFILGRIIFARPSNKAVKKTLCRASCAC